MRIFVPPLPSALSSDSFTVYQPEFKGTGENKPLGQFHISARHQKPIHTKKFDSKFLLPRSLFLITICEP